MKYNQDLYNYTAASLNEIVKALYHLADKEAETAKACLEKANQDYYKGKAAAFREAGDILKRTKIINRGSKESQ